MQSELPTRSQKSLLNLEERDLYTHMDELDEIKDTLWLYTTFENHPTQVDEAFANLKDFGDQVINGLTWGFK